METGPSNVPWRGKKIPRTSGVSLPAFLKRCLAQMPVVYCSVCFIKGLYTCGCRTKRGDFVQVCAIPRGELERYFEAQGP